MGIQIRMVNVDNSQYIVASGQGTATQVGEGMFKNPQMGFDQAQQVPHLNLQPL